MEPGFRFRLGINLKIEIPALDSAIEAAEKSMHTAQQNLAATQAQLDIAHAELDAWHAEQRAIEDVSTRLHALGPALAQAESVLDKHRARLADGANAALDVGMFFGGLVVRSAEWGRVITSAPALADVVVKLQQLLETNTQLTGVFMTSPALLDDELKRLADSNVPPDSLSVFV